MNFDFKKINKRTKSFIDQAIESCSESSSTNYRVYIRPSGTEPLLRVLVEAKNQEKVNDLSKEIITKLSSEIYKISNNI